MYPFANELGARYRFKRESTENHYKKIDFLFPKIITLNGNYYVYNNYLPKDNQRLFKITKINGIDIKEITHVLKKDGYIPVEIIKLIQQKEVLSLYGFDGKGYKVTLEDDNETYEIDLDSPNPKIDFDIFYKKHKVSNLLNKDNFDLDNDNYKEEVSYSYDVNLRLIKLLRGLSKGDNDRKKLESIYNKNKELFGRGTNNDKNIDWMFISSFFLLNGEEKNKLADFQYIELERFINNSPIEYIKYLDKDSPYDNNQLILNNGRPDISLVFHCVRNAFAHSSYEVYDENYVRIFGSNESDYDFLIHIDIVKKFVNILYGNKTINDNFPILFGVTNSNNRSISSREKLERVLKEAEVIAIDKISFRDTSNSLFEHFKNKSFIGNIKTLKGVSNEELLNLYSLDYNDTLEKMKTSKQISMIYDEEGLITYIRNKLSDFIKFRLINRKLTKEEIQNILVQIDNNQDKFYEHSMLNQHEVLTEMVRKRRS